MSLTDQLKKGMVIRHDGHLYSVVDFNLAQTGKQKPTVHIKLRDIRTGRPSDRTLEQLGKIDEVDSENRQMQYLYAAGDKRVFMDSETYEQHELGADLLGDAARFLIEEESYRFHVVAGDIVAIQLPDIVTLEVADTAPVEHAGGHSSVQKEAKLSSGTSIQVPLFIKTGDKIRVRTDSCEYHGKEH